MKREIKFEAYIEDLNIILKNIIISYGMIGISDDDLEAAIKGKFKIWDDQIVDTTEDHNFIMGIDCGDDWYWFEEGQFKLRQYIGLRDRDNNEIYEGDIIEKTSDGFVGIVEYEPQGAQFVFRNIYEKRFRTFIEQEQYGDENGISLTGIKILGNIYQNPSLIIHAEL